MASHIPFNPIKLGSIVIVTTTNIKDLKTDIIADICPSPMAVKYPDIKIFVPIIKNPYENNFIPDVAIV